MQFIVKTNAATAVGLERLKERLDALAALAAQHETDLQIRTEWLTVLSRSVQEMATRMESGFTTLARAQASTEENLNMLIRTVQDMLASSTATVKRLSRPPQLSP